MEGCTDVLNTGIIENKINTTGSEMPSIPMDLRILRKVVISLSLGVTVCFDFNSIVFTFSFI